RRNHLCYEELILANRTIDHWLPPAGTTVTLPTRYILPPGPREGIVVNIEEFRLYDCPKPKKKDSHRVVQHFSFRAGRDDWPTPTDRPFAVQAIKNALTRRPSYDVDWDSLDVLLGKAQGMPVAIPPRAKEQAGDARYARVTSAGTS